MPILVIADLHLDFWLGAGRDPFAALDPIVLASLDALILAGDIANKPRVRWPNMFRHIACYVRPEITYVVPGNHDYFDHIVNGDERLRNICDQAGVRFAQKSEIMLGEVRILCCTLWTDFCLHGDPASAMRIAEQGMKDYRSGSVHRTRH